VERELLRWFEFTFQQTGPRHSLNGSEIIILAVRAALYMRPAWKRKIKIPGRLLWKRERCHGGESQWSCSTKYFASQKLRARAHSLTAHTMKEKKTPRHALGGAGWGLHVWGGGIEAKRGLENFINAFLLLSCCRCIFDFISFDWLFQSGETPLPVLISHFGKSSRGLSKALWTMTFYKWATSKSSFARV